MKRLLSGTWSANYYFESDKFFINIKDYRLGTWLIILLESLG